MPPASKSPTIARSWVVISAKPMRITVAAMIPIKDRLARCSFGRSSSGQADDDGIVARQHQVDPDDLHQGDEALIGEDFHLASADFNLKPLLRWTFAGNGSSRLQLFKRAKGG